MTRRHLSNAVFTAVAVSILAIGGLGQGKGHGGGDKHGGGGNPHGGGNGNGRGQEVRIDQPGRGNGKHVGDDGQREIWAQQQRAVQQQEKWQQRAIQQQQRQAEWDARMQQRQNEWNARRQQDAIRQQQEAFRRQQVQAYDNPGRGHKNGWNADGPRGNAYGLRGIWPGEFRGWRDPDKQARKAAKEAEKDLRRSQRQQYYYNSDPLVTWMPRVYRERYYQQPADTYPQSYGYSNVSPYYGYGNSGSTRDAVVRTIISSFFGGGDPYYSNSYYAAPAYSGYSAYPSYQTRYLDGPYYQTYSPYSGGYDPYYAAPLYGGEMFGGTGLKSTLLNVGFSLLQGFLGQGYTDGLLAGQYARTNRIDGYYDPYTYDNAYYSPYVSSLADQRRIFDEGYRMGYEDAMRNRDPYGTLYRAPSGVNLISEFLSGSLL